MSTRALTAALCVFAALGCRSSAELTGTEGDGPTDAASPADTNAVDDSFSDAIATEEGPTEDCPSPDYPPRTDGCPCRVQDPRFCYPANEGKTCVYNATCSAGYALRYVCRRVQEFEKPDRWTWVEGCARGADCDSGECLQPLGDAGTDG